MKNSASPGQLLKAVIKPGKDVGIPGSGDRVVFHYTTRTSDGVIVESTQSEVGGLGVPLKLVLGKSKMIKGWEEALPTMQKGEVAMFKVKSEFHYGDPECPVKAPENFPEGDELLFQIEMIDFYKVKVVIDDLGTLKQVLCDGEGWETPREPYEVRASITGRISDGDTFLAHKEDPIHFVFGKNEVPNGLEKAIGTMTKGERAVIYVCKPYITEASAIPNLPTHVQEVEFEVELLQIIQVRDMVGDGGCVKRRVRDGIGEFPVDCPLQDSRLQIHYKGILPNFGSKVFYDTRTENNGEPFEFSSGEGMVPEGLEMCVRLMLPGELAVINCVSKYAYDKFPRPDSVPEGASVQWEVELLGFEKQKDWTGLTFEEIMNEALKLKATGNRLFKEGKYELAKAKYDFVLRDFKHINPHNDKESSELNQSQDSLLLNVAACYQKTGEYIKSIETCNKVLEGNPHHVKALYRRGMAYSVSGDFEEARADFLMMMKVDETSAADAKIALGQLKKREQESELKLRKQFKGLFDKKPGSLSERDSNDEVVHPQPEPASPVEQPQEEIVLKELTKSFSRHSLDGLFQEGRRAFKKTMFGRCSIV